MEDQYKLGDSVKPSVLLCPCYCHCGATDCRVPPEMRWSPAFGHTVQIFKTVLRSLPSADFSAISDFGETGLLPHCASRCAVAAAEAEIHAELKARAFKTVEDHLAPYFI